VLLDIGLPKIGGLEVCRRIREQPWGKSMMLVALTGLGQNDDRRKSMAAGFDRHIVKPVDFDALLRLLAEQRAVSA
jgi:CheY-like chemotaxis protein